MGSLLVAGCDRAKIRRYEVAKSVATNETSAVSSSSEAKPKRLIAAIWPGSKRTWFFKLMGPPEEVALQQKAFDQFIQSVELDAEGPNGIDWTLPEGWKEKESSGSSMRYATLVIGSEPNPLEVTVTPLGPEASKVLPNVNRWRRQIGLSPVGKGDVKELVEKKEIGGETVTIVDMTGPGSRNSGMAPFASSGASSGGSIDPSRKSSAPQGGVDPRNNSGSAMATGEEDDSKIDFTVPEGWEPNPGGSAMRTASFQVVQDGQKCDISVISLTGKAGGLLANVNRWRRQIGLKPVSQSELDEVTQELQLAGRSATYVDLKPSNQGSDGDTRILAAVTRHGGQSWFFKLRGPSSLVASQKSAFKRFVKSVTFNSQEAGGGDGQ